MKNLLVSAAAASILLAASAAEAVDKCAVKVDKKTGVIRVDAAGVSGPLLWGSTADTVTSEFANDATCIAGSKAKKCELAAPSTLAAKTPPAGCTIYLDDAGAPCSAWIRGCVPGPRQSAAFVWRDANGVVLGAADDGPNLLRYEGTQLLRFIVRNDSGGIDLESALYFVAPACAGTPLVLGSTAAIRQVANFGPTGPAYYAAEAGTPTSHASYQYSRAAFTDQAACDTFAGGPGLATYVAPFSCCLADAAVQPLAPATPVDISGFVPPFQLTPQ